MLRLLPYMVIYNGLRYKIMKLPTKRRCLILRFCHGLILSMHYSIIVVLVSGIVSEFLNMTFCIQNTDTVSPSPDLFQIHKVLIKFLCIFNYNNIPSELVTELGPSVRRCFLFCFFPGCSGALNSSLQDPISHPGLYSPRARAVP